MSSNPPVQKRVRWGSLVFALLLLVAVIAINAYVPQSVDTQHVTLNRPVPGNVDLPPTITPVP